MLALKAANLALKFLLELAAIAAFAYSGATLRASEAAQRALRFV
jgi:hypothetical protein